MRAHNDARKKRTPISYTDAIHKLRNLANEQQAALQPRQSTQTLPLVDAVGYTAARAVKWQLPVPQYNTAAMDGYLLNYQHTANASQHVPVRCEVVGCIAAGDCIDASQLKQPAAGTAYAYEIMTGAIVPDCTYYNAVVRVEDTAIVSIGTPQYVDIHVQARSQQHIRCIGEEYKQGETIVSAHQLITATHIALLAMNGNNRVDVLPKLRIAVISTGSELVTQYNQSQPHQLRAGQIYNSNAPYIIATLQQHYNCTVEHIDTVCDDLQQTAQCIEQHCTSGRYDILITTGAVSAGKFDYVPAAIQSLPACTQVLHHVAIRPGGPIMISKYTHNGVVIPVFSLPGTPIAVMVGLRFFLAPYISMLSHHADASTAVAHDSTIMTLACTLDAHIKLARFVPARLSASSECSPTRITDTAHTASTAHIAHKCSAFANIQQATHWIYIPAQSQPQIQAGNPITVYTAQPHFQHHTLRSTVTIPSAPAPILQISSSLCVLLLCGGYSTRMGSDKALLVHPTSRQTLLQHHTQLCQTMQLNNIAVSCREEQIDVFKQVPLANQSVEYVTDTYRDIGPAGGILSVYTAHWAQQKYTSHLVLAVDFIHVERDSIDCLLQQHAETQPRPMVTCYQHDDGMPEPLFAVWSSAALAWLQNNALIHERTGPCYTIKQMLKNPQMQHMVKLVKPLQPSWLVNTNTQQQYADACQLLHDDKQSITNGDSTAVSGSMLSTCSVAVSV